MIADFAPIETPVGDVMAIVDDRARLTDLYFMRGKRPRSLHAEAPSPAASALIAEVKRQLTEYFEGTRREFAIELNPQGTEFERAVWRTLLDIPYGETATYGFIAKKVGKPDGAQAVGRANGANPIPIVIPCHRVIGSDGRLVGYGGGLDVKETLLRHEGALPPSLGLL